MENKRDNRELTLEVVWQPIVTNCPSWDRLWGKLLTNPPKLPSGPDAEGVEFPRGGEQ